jgi:DNA-binding CsgD family transcriptional regulator
MELREQKVVLSLLRELATAESVAALRATVPAIRSLFRAECLLYSLTESGIAARAESEDVCFRYPREHFQHDPVHSYKAKAIEPTVVLLARTPGWDAFQLSATYHEVYAPARMHEGMCASFHDLRYGDVGTGGAFVFRPPGAPSFSDDDAALFTALLPSFEAVARRERRAQENAALRSLVDMRAAYPTILADLDGRALWSSEAAKSVLAANGVIGAELPHTLMNAVRSIGRSSREVMPVLQCALAPGSRVICDLQLIQSGSSYVLIELHTNQEGLTKAEKRVLPLVEQGLSNREIAEVLFVSVETIRTHTKRIYAKHGVASRRELLVSRRLS